MVETKYETHPLPERTGEIQNESETRRPIANCCDVNIIERTRRLSHARFVNFPNTSEALFLSSEGVAMSTAIMTPRQSLDGLRINVD